MPKIIVLEDDARRLTEMQRVTTNQPADVVFFDNAVDLCDWLDKNHGSVGAMSLDCDLDTTAARESVDPGSGEDVAEYLSGLAVRFPVMIHSSNAMRAPAMHMTLALSGWNRIAVAPYTSAESWWAELEDFMS